MPKPVLSIVTTVIDGVEKINFYLILNNEVIAIARIEHPRDPMPVLYGGFVSEKHRGNGYWGELYKARLLWIMRNNSKAKYLYLYVDPTNTMRGTYLRIGFQYTGDIETGTGDKQMRLKLK